MPQYIITHTNAHGEHHKLAGVWHADTPDMAVALMLADCGHIPSDIDGDTWTAHEVTSDRDVMP